MACGAVPALGSAFGWQKAWRRYPGHDKGRLMVAICHNVDPGDAWEWADDPKDDEKFSALAFRIASNYVVYSMTHRERERAKPRG